MKHLKYVYLGFFTFIVLGVSTTDAQQNLAQEAYAIFENSCLGCHGPNGPFTEQLVIESASQLVASGAVVPGSPIQSELYTRLFEEDDAKRMPLGQPRLSGPAIQKIGAWIQAGAPSWEVEHDVTFISTDKMLTTIQNHLRTLSAFDRPAARYFTMTHLYNAGEGPEVLRAAEIALSKLVNSLSWGYTVVKPEALDPQRTIFYIDLRDYEWDTRDAWTQIETLYPYVIAFDASTQARLHTKLEYLKAEMVCEVPFVHVDWFLATASLPPLYHDILALPETEAALERDLGIDVSGNLQRAPGLRVLRAGTNDSGVSAHNRVVERHSFRNGAYWKSHDFASSVGRKNILQNPLSFDRDGGEVIFNLPNGLQAYYVSDALGDRIDVAPTDIVSNPAASDPAVRNGLSCIGCHTEGMKTFEDVVRGTYQRLPASATKDQVLRLYVEKAEMDRFVAQDTARYREALEATGGVFGGIEPVHRFHERFQEALDASHAAAVLGLHESVFVEAIGENSGLQELGLAGLLSGGNVKRDAWTANFSEIADCVYNEVCPTPAPTPIPIPTPDPVVPPSIIRDPNNLVPDVNLRAAIAEALGKPSGASLKTEDIARLTRLVADEKGIRDLKGLEYAVKLERIELHHNAISDLSPLAGLRHLKNIKLRGNRITDISPLKGLISVDWLGLEENEIRDLSPLAGLRRLNGLGIEGNPVSDVSPLSGMLSLEGINARDTAISDFSPLAKLPRLRWIEFSGNASIFKLSSLKGLKTLRRLEINHAGISDISGLSELTQLQELTLRRNLIKDVSPLRNLKSLTHLDLSDNVIVDVSPLAGLNGLKHLDLRNNAISDFSPLEDLSENTYVGWFGNPGRLSQGGAKIRGPWLWVLVPGTTFYETADPLAQASSGKVTELKVATNGATEGEAVGENVWAFHSISSGNNNINTMLNALGVDWNNNGLNVIYGVATLQSPREQQTKLFAGSDDHHKVWLNGKLVSEHGDWRGDDYQEFSQVTLKQGKNVLLVAINNYGGRWNGFFGFSPDAEYTVLSTASNFSLSTEPTQIAKGDTFTLRLNANNMTDLAGWQADLVFDPDVFKVGSVTEGNFLKQKGGRTHFQKGTIDNQKGKIAGLSSTRISQGGVDGEGRLLSVNFTAKATGKTWVLLRQFRAGSSAGKTILSSSPEISIAVGGRSTPTRVSTPTPSGTGFSLSTNTTSVPVGDTFILRLSAEKIDDLAGWQTDITFDPDRLEAVKVNEGDFLKTGGVGTFFLRGTIDNKAGKITQINSARLSGGVDGTGTLLSVTFSAKAVGDTRITLSNLQAGNSSTAAIPLDMPDIVITIGAAAFPAWDVNQDGQVNVLDLIGVAQHLGTAASANRHADINGDGTINVLDLIAVAQHLGESSTAAAPSVVNIEGLGVDPATIHAWIAQVRVEDDGSVAFREAIANLEQLLSLFVPEETVLLHNYPNPFNPETWIPYHLSEPAEVTIRIYATSGVLVRTLALGYQPVGIYQDRSRAAYWDGENAVGESVASGVYFYTLTAGDFTATRKMLIRK